MARLKGKIDLSGALRGVPPMRGPPLRDLEGQFFECIADPPLFSCLEDKNCRRYRAPAPFFPRLKTKNDECIVRPPLFSTLGGTFCRMYRAPALFVRTWKECFALFSPKCIHSRTFFCDLCPLSHNTPPEVARGRPGAVQTGVLTAQPESAPEGPFES